MEGPIWETDSEIKAELEAMAGYGKNITVPDSKMLDVPKRKIKKRKSKVHTKKSVKSVDTVPASTSGSVDQAELINIIKQPAFTSEEKFRVLDARDKLIRQKTKRNTDIAFAKHILGTCPDMCPEKERLMREVQHQVSIYEQEPGEKVMNSSLAVKQYSRSSADQEVPLPHELRPVSVLQRTMSYLLHKIVDLCDNPDVNLAEWYHFLWDRTRGIRKDITQQELCCKGSVELVEQCARFHIHCSARLVAEDLSVFDQKINTENLTKCLQTLKYMYHDLQLKNESCPKEAEFRAYIILLNLNDANFMWEVQQLKREIQKSEEVQFALKVYSALDKNNYVKFFNLVRSTSYLNACILLRYFIQVRIQALTTIIKSYSPRTPHTQFPLKEMERILAFEGRASTIDFVEYHGLHLNENKTHIILDRKTFQMPELPYTLDRAMNVIESKRKYSVGETICGKPLDPINFDKHVPRNSFDSNGLIDISEYLPDIDLTIPQKDTEKIAKIENKSEVFGKSTQSFAFQTSIFAIRGSSDSRSNSPMDTIDKGSEVKSESSVFWSKPEKKSGGSIFTTKSENSNQSSIFGMPKEEKPTHDFLVKTISDQKPLVYNSEQTGSIFSQSITQFANKLDEPEQSNKTQISKPFFFSSSVPEFPKATQKPAELTPHLFSSSTTASFKTGGLPSSAFLPYTSVQTSRSGGFFFNLQTTAPSVNVSTVHVAAPLAKHEPKYVKSPERKLEIRKEKVTQIQKQLEQKVMAEKERLENEKKRRLKEKQMALEAVKIEAEKRRMEEISRRNIEEVFRRRKMKEEDERKRKERQKIEEEKRRVEERRRIEKQKQAEEMLRKAREMEERKIREMKSTILEVVEDLMVKVEDKIRDEKLESICQKIKLQKAFKYFGKWKNCVIVNKRKRKAIDQWPIWVSWTTQAEEASQLYMKNQTETLKYMKRYKSGFPIDIYVDRELKIDQIDLKKLTYHILSTKFREFQIRSHHYFWKIDIFTASLSYMTTTLKWIDKLINELFSWEDKTCVLMEESKISSNKITYCIKRREGYKQEDTDGYIFIGDDLSDEFYEDVKNIIRSSKNHVNLPVVIVLQNDNYDERRISDLLCSGHVSTCKIISGKYTPEKLISSTQEALVYLAENVPRAPPLELDSLRLFLQKYLASEIWKRMTSYGKWNRPYKTCLTNPEIVISLYNEAVHRLESITFDTNSMDYADFPEVFQEHFTEKIPSVLPCDYKYFPSFWKNDSYRGKIRRVFSELNLPQFETNWPPKDVNALEQMISEFSSKFFRNNSLKKAYKIIASILRFFDPVRNFDEIRHVLWTDVIEIVIAEKLKEIDYSLREPFLSQTVFDELFVVYNKNDLNNYKSSTWFYLNNPIIEKQLNINEYNNYDDDVGFEEEEVEAEEAEIDLETSLLEAAQARFDREEKINASKQDLREFENLMADLEQSMNIQKQISRRFEELLASALRN